jgi:DNA/RNA-binding domain of Phe-tRNA-synthetase-like protein
MLPLDTPVLPTGLQRIVTAPVTIGALTMLMPVFRLDTPAELGLKAIAFTLHGLNNRMASARLQHRLAELRADFDAERSRSVQQGFCALRQRIGRLPGVLPPAPQALLEIYRTRGRLPNVSPLVDLANQWSLNSGLSISVHDLAQLRLPVTLGLTSGGERFQVRESLPPLALPAGEYACFDGRGRVLNRMEALQSAATAVRAETRSVLVIIQGHAQIASDQLYAVAQGLKADLQEYCCASSACGPALVALERLALGR